MRCPVCVAGNTTTLYTSLAVLPRSIIVFVQPYMSPMHRNEDAMRRFGRHLAVLRKQKGLSLRELAVASGLGYRQIVQIEAGEVNLLFTTLLALSKGLGVTPDQLLKSL